MRACASCRTSRTPPSLRSASRRAGASALRVGARNARLRSAEAAPWCSRCARAGRARTEVVFVGGRKGDGRLLVALERAAAAPRLVQLAAAEERLVLALLDQLAHLRLLERRAVAQPIVEVAHPDRHVVVPQLERDERRAARRLVDRLRRDGLRLCHLPRHGEGKPFANLPVLGVARLGGQLVRVQMRAHDREG